MSLLFWKAFWNLMSFDLYLLWGDFARLRNHVRRYPVRAQRITPESVNQIVSAVDRASIWYWKQVLCLQRSAATACLLKSHGLRAELVIGSQSLPFKAHAWVEVEGQVVNDKPYVRDIYAVLDRC